MSHWHEVMITKYEHGAWKRISSANLRAEWRLKNQPTPALVGLGPPEPASAAWVLQKIQSWTLKDRLQQQKTLHGEVGSGQHWDLDWSIPEVSALTDV